MCTYMYTCLPHAQTYKTTICSQSSKIVHWLIYWYAKRESTIATAAKCCNGKEREKIRRNVWIQNK